jgi:hypothetical protein
MYHVLTSLLCCGLGYIEIHYVDVSLWIHNSLNRIVGEKYSKYHDSVNYRSVMKLLFDVGKSWCQAL